MVDDKVRINLTVTKEVADLIDKMSEDVSGNRSEVIRRALSVLATYYDEKHKAKSNGTEVHIGFADDRKKLDLELVNVL